MRSTTQKRLSARLANAKDLNSVARRGVAVPKQYHHSRNTTTAFEQIDQGVPAGQFTREKANLSTRSDQSDAFDGRLALDGIRPVAAFDDLDGTTVVREWNGQGSVNDPANWSVLRIPTAFGPRIVGGASGLLLLSHTALDGGTLQVRSISPGAASSLTATGWSSRCIRRSRRTAPS